MNSWIIEKTSDKELAWPMNQMILRLKDPPEIKTSPAYPLIWLTSALFDTQYMDDGPVPEPSKSWY